MKTIFFKPFLTIQAFGTRMLTADDSDKADLRELFTIYHFYLEKKEFKE